MGKSTAVIDARRSRKHGPTAGDLRKESPVDEIVRRKALPIDTCSHAFTRGRAAAISVRRRRRLHPESSAVGAHRASNDGASDGSASRPRFGKNTPERATEERMPRRSTRPSRPGSVRGAVKHAVHSFAPLARRRWGITAPSKGVRCASRSSIEWVPVSTRVSMVDAGCTHLWPVCVFVRESGRGTQALLGARDRFEGASGRTSGSHPDGDPAAYTV